MSSGVALFYVFKKGKYMAWLLFMACLGLASARAIIAGFSNS